MGGRKVLTIAAVSALLFGMASAQTGAPAQGGAAQSADTAKVQVSFVVTQDGKETAILEKGKLAEVVATVKVNLPGVKNANVQVIADIADQLNIENEADVKVKGLYIDNGSGFSLQPTSSVRPRLGFLAPEGQTGITGTQRVKWVLDFVNVAPRAPFSVNAAAVIPPSNEIVGQARAEQILKVVSSLTVQQLWIDGGIFMWPLGFCLIIGIAFALERMFTLTFAQINTEKFFTQLAAAMKEGGVEKAIEVCNGTRGPVAAVLREGLLRVKQGIDHVEKAIASAGAVEASFLQRGMIVIASVTVIAPFFGFLGTVWGMVIAFKAIAEAGDVNPTIVANGISQALITTVGGLIIAIISQSLYNFLLSRINRIVIDMEETSTKLVDLLIEEGMDKPASS
ncbi:MAG TPA: MotA/TolQ/ExbB proton channel family protein [Candidatus Latescibacteria bacterium]|nr:MotA/TolQ/ExbB proton channel family protein [Candidatus Latescibacterota bacterium]